MSPQLCHHIGMATSRRKMDACETVLSTVSSTTRASQDTTTNIPDFYWRRLRYDQDYASMRVKRKHASFRSLRSRKAHWQRTQSSIPTYGVERGGGRATHSVHARRTSSAALEQLADHLDVTRRRRVVQRSASILPKGAGLLNLLFEPSLSQRTSPSADYMHSSLALNFPFFGGKTTGASDNWYGEFEWDSAEKAEVRKRNTES